MSLDWRMSAYDLPLGPKSFRPSPPGKRFLFVRHGVCRVETPAGTRSLGAGEAASLEDGASIGGEGLGWLFEVAPDGAELLGGTVAPIVLSTPIALPERGPRLLRLDRIDLTPGARTPLHFHRGPGMRRLLFGRVRVDVGRGVVGAEAGGAWFEPGDEPVLGANVNGGDSAFVRFSLLPVELKGGKSSFIPASETEAAKPRAVAQNLLGEAVIDGVD